MKWNAYMKLLYNLSLLCKFHCTLIGSYWCEFCWFSLYFSGSFLLCFSHFFGSQLHTKQYLNRDNVEYLIGRYIVKNTIHSDHYNVGKNKHKYQLQTSRRGPWQLFRLQLYSLSEVYWTAPSSQRTRISMHHTFETLL